MLCPFCEEDFLLYGPLAWHLLKQHDSQVTGLQRPTGQDWWRVNVAIVCWCGQVFDINTNSHRPMSPWAEHLQERKGPISHLLELRLGLCDNGD